MTAAASAARIPPRSRHQVAEYSFKSSAFFGSKMNLRSSAVRLAQEDWRRGIFPVPPPLPSHPPPPRTRLLTHAMHSRNH